MVYEPLAEDQYDEEDNDPTSPHYDTPHRLVKDGLGREIGYYELNQGTEYVTRYQWNPLGTLTAIVDANGNQRTFVHDGLGRRTDLLDLDIGHWRYVYDDANNLLEHYDSKGQIVRLTYDSANRPLHEDHVGADGSVTPQATWHYDTTPAGRTLTNVKGRLAWVETPTVTDYHAYDSRGRLAVSETAVDGDSYSTRIAYNALDHETERTYPDGARLLTQYNARQLVSQVGGLVTKLEYDASGNETARRYGNGVDTSLEYDTRERLRSLTSTRGSTTIQALTLGFDRHSNVTSITDGAGQATQTFTHDDLYRLTQAQGGYGTLGFSYDPIGNLLLRDADQAQRLALGQYEYTGAGPRQVTRVGGDEYLYDENGNLASGRGRTFEYDADQRLVQATLAAGTTVEMGYDADGDRRLKRTRSADGNVRQTVYIDSHSEIRDGALVKYIWANGKRLVEVGPSAQLAANPPAAALTGWGAALGALLVLSVLLVCAWVRAWWPRGVRLGLATALLGGFALCLSCGPGTKPLDHFPGDARAYHSDHLGSTNLVTDARGEVVLKELSHPFGTEWLREGAAASRYRYTGKEYDEELGLFYFGKRYYDPLLAKWATPDRHFLEQGEAAVGEAQQCNLYSYVGNRPLTVTDPTGACPWCPMLQRIATSPAARSATQFLQRAGTSVWGWVLKDPGRAANTVATVGELAAGAPGNVPTPPVARRMATLADLPSAPSRGTLLQRAWDRISLRGLLRGSESPAPTGRAREIQGALKEGTQRRTTTAVIRTQEGTTVVSSSERRLRPAQRQALRPGEVEGVGPGHAEVTGVKAAKSMGLTPTSAEASRPICPECASFLKAEGVEATSPLKR
jgi:RHS repeat-associated protein